MKANGKVIKYGDNIDTDVTQQTIRNLRHTVWKI